MNLFIFIKKQLSVLTLLLLASLILVGCGGFQTGFLAMVPVVTTQQNLVSSGFVPMMPYYHQEIVSFASVAPGEQNFGNRVKHYWKNNSIGSYHHDKTSITSVNNNSVKNVENNLNINLENPRIKKASHSITHYWNNNIVDVHHHHKASSGVAISNVESPVENS